ncbi:MAG: xanthine dehydrogenase accessory factor [Frankiales bacterium]|nr:xanthine dehydrogenase accessory factor [Frankiales bacterium]
MLAEVWPFVRACSADGQPVALARVVSRTGTTGRPVGATMAVAADGRWAGSVAGGCVDGDVLTTAAAVLAGAPATLVRCDLGPDSRPAWETGPACTGSVSVLISELFDEMVCAAVGLVLDSPPTESDRPPLTLRTSLEPPYETRIGPYPDTEVMVDTIRAAPRLVLVGATDIAMSLSAFAAAAGFRVVVLEPRPAYALEDRVPAATLVRAWPSAWLGGHPLGPDDSLVALTHEPRLDDAALVQALRSCCGYVAAIGSRATHEERLARLAHIPGAELIHGPAGLNLGGASAAQTALSVLAEVVAVRNGRDGAPLVLSPGRVHVW